MSALSAPYLHDEAAAFEFVESVLWPNGAVCPHCGGVDRITKVKANPEKRIRVGLHRCGDCKRQFTVKVGTVFEASKVKMHLWVQAVVLMTASKKGISAHQLHRTLGVTYKTAWFMEHRIREAMRDGDLAPFGSGGGVVEVDETFIGHDKKHLHRYVGEFAFRYNNRIANGVGDHERARVALSGAAGKRLTYRRAHEGAL